MRNEGHFRRWRQELHNCSRLPRHNTLSGRGKSRRSERLQLRYSTEQQRTSTNNNTAVGCCGGSWRKQLVNGHRQEKTHTHTHTPQTTHKTVVGSGALCCSITVALSPTGAKRETLSGVRWSNEFNSTAGALLLSYLVSPSLGCGCMISYSSLHVFVCMIYSFPFGTTLRFTGPVPEDSRQ